MALFPISIPPGIKRDGTEYGSKGRFYDAFLTRWTEAGTLRPVLGNRLRSSNPANVVTGSARSIITWADNSSTTVWIGIGTHSGWFIQERNGDVSDITPVGFISGYEDAAAEGGYGAGKYGDDDYGTPRPDSTLIRPATQWTQDTWGEDLLGVSPDDGKIYQWTPPSTGTHGVAVSGAPTCKAIVVTPEGFLFALASTDPRTLSWSDQRDNTTWTPAPTNQAGDFTLQTQGKIMCGKVVKGGTLILTDLDAHFATYIGGNDVYSIDRVGKACGAISRQCVAAIDTQAVWMGKKSFWLYNGGTVSPLPCDLQDYVFSDFNTLQASKTYAVSNSVNSEVEFYYCSDASKEIDRCVIWNTKFGYWNIGRPPRTCGTDSGVLEYPVMVNADGEIFEHEVGFDYGADTPYAETGPIELGNGDQMVTCLGMIPDEKTSGQVSVSFKGKYEPNGSEYGFGPYALTAKTDFRIQARQLKMRYTGVVPADWRVGDSRLDIVPGEMRG
ncbi:MAG TPA: hypothetical protein VJQ06_05225 [Rhizomicrobium sp.]|nr:hypothetical protein [Rhizomicrobium sp.]